MIGSRLLGQQPTFRGADFAIPEVALFGYYQFRSAVATSDSWEQHDGVEILFMRSGEACWDLADEHLSVVNGSQAVMFPAGQRHRIANGVYTPVPPPLDGVSSEGRSPRENARLFPKEEIEALFDIATRQDAPVDLPETCARNLSDLCSRLTDERLHDRLRADHGRGALEALFVGHRTLGDVRQRSRYLRRTASSCAAPRRLLRETPTTATDGDESIAEVARQLGYGKSRLYSLFAREIGMAPNDYRQRVRIKRCCERLVGTNESITEIGLSAGFASSQYFARVFKKYVGVSPTAYRRLFGARPSH